MTLRVLDLFSGVGGFSLGLERAGGFRTVAFCEIDPFCRRVLAKHWSEVPCYHDIRELNAERLAADGIGVDVLCGGFPCQDISVAGAGAGLDGERSGLWSEFARLIRELRPRYALVENVSALLHRGLDRVLCDLAAIGYDAEWHAIPASAVGAPHRRDRVWIVAHPHRDGEHALSVDAEMAVTSQPVADPAWDVRAEQAAGGAERERVGLGREPIGMADASCQLLDGAGIFGPERWGQSSDDGRRSAQSRMGQPPDGISTGLAGPWEPGWEDGVARVAHGVPERVAKLRALGNAVVPQIPELLGRAILAARS